MPGSGYQINKQRRRYVLARQGDEKGAEPCPTDSGWRVTCVSRSELIYAFLEEFILSFTFGECGSVSDGLRFLRFIRAIHLYSRSIGKNKNKHTYTYTKAAAHYTDYRSATTFRRWGQKPRTALTKTKPSHQKRQRAIHLEQNGTHASQEGDHRSPTVTGSLQSRPVT